MFVKAIKFSSAAVVLFGGAAFAEVDIESSDVRDFEYGQAEFDASGLQVCRLYVGGLDAGDSVLSMSGIPGSAMNIAANNTFFNGAEFGQGSGAPASALFPAFPSLQWDTWLAIGDKNISLSPGFPDVAMAGGGVDVIDHENAAWFNDNPGDPMFADDDGRVLIGQFAYAADESFYFSANVQIVRADGSEDQIWVSKEIICVPAPAAMALLGVAGLAGSRRRRA